MESLGFDNKEEAGLPFDFSDWRPNPEEQYTQTELRGLLTRLLHDLRPALRVVFIMHDIEGGMLQEVAEALDLTLAAGHRGRGSICENSLLFILKMTQRECGRMSDGVSPVWLLSPQAHKLVDASSASFLQVDAHRNKSAQNQFPR